MSATNMNMILDGFITSSNYEQLEKYILESDHNTRQDININIFSKVAQNDELLKFLLKISTDSDLKEFNYVKDEFFANVMISSCATSDDVVWMFKKMKEYELEPENVLKASGEMFRYYEPELEPFMLALMNMLKPIYYK